MVRLHSRIVRDGSQGNRGNTANHHATSLVRSHGTRRDFRDEGITDNDRWRYERQMRAIAASCS